MMKGRYLVRWFTSTDGQEIEASLLKVGSGYRWRMAYVGEKRGFAFGSVCNPWEASAELTRVARLFGFTEHDEIVSREGKG